MLSQDSIFRLKLKKLLEKTATIHNTCHDLTPEDIILQSEYGLRGFIGNAI
jgi:hypothetical protein